MPANSDQVKRILTVCTGNICRSPAAERLLARLLWSDVTVSSAGTGSVVDAPIESTMAGLLQADGVTTANFRASQLTADQISQADLVLAMTTDHRGAVVNLVPAAIKYSFTLLEFARIAGLAGPELGWPLGQTDPVVNAPPPIQTGPSAPLPIRPTPANRLSRLIALAPAWRPWARPPAGQSDDVPDPYRRSPATYAASYDLIRQAISQIALTIWPETAR